MTESACEEALRLAKKAVGANWDLLFATSDAAGFTLAEIEYLISLARVGWIEIDKAAELAARQRPGWVWVPRKATTEMLNAIDDYDIFEETEELWAAVLAAAPKPEAGT
jgi:hypothetical protein